MVATTDQKARLLDLVTGVLELTRDGKRDAGAVCELLQLVKDNPEFARLIVGVKAKLLKFVTFVTTVSLPGIDRFVARDHFQVGEHNGVKIAWLGDNFKRHFPDKVEEGIGAAELKIHKLLQPAPDPPIIAELGEHPEITLGQLFALLQKQGNGEPGPLLVNGWANIAYIRDQDGANWAVFVYRRVGGRGWVVGADSVGDPCRWGDGRQICSR